MINGLVIDRVLQATGFSKSTNEPLYRLTQVQNPSLTSSADQVDALDNTGVKIMSFDRNAAATFSAENAVKDMALLAQQLGSSQVESSDAKKVTVPAFDVIDVVAGQTEYTLANTPKVTPSVYVLNGDGSLGVKIENDTAAAEGKFAYAEGKVTIVIGEAIKADARLVVMYDYEAAAGKAVSIVNNANVFAKAHRLVVEVLAYDPCDTDTMIYMYLIFPNCKMSRNFDLTLDTESAHSFEVECMVDYCSKDKKLFEIVIPE
jgi:LysM repeat protein